MKKRTSPILNPGYKTVGDITVESGRTCSSQLGWYAFAGKFCKGDIVLDVGCGLGKGLELLSKEALKASGIDLDERLRKECVEIKDISKVGTKTVDTVVAMDVIEHVENDVDFAKDLVRVARKQVIVSTPNYTFMRCKWPYHVREYTPGELVGLFRDAGQVELYKGSNSGDDVFPVKYLWVYFLINELRMFFLTAFIMRCLNRILPYPMKIHPHLLIRVLLR
ncbi:MAG TPA: hypothetical protein DCL35_05340 [Candidatus Omnitrophica bacterium]|nr:hypothetical protein [Candidatus Omnitrophota bacterium]